MFYAFFTIFLSPCIEPLLFAQLDLVATETNKTWPFALKNPKVEGEALVGGRRFQKRVLKAEMKQSTDKYRRTEGRDLTQSHRTGPERGRKRISLTNAITKHQ